MYSHAGPGGFWEHLARHLERLAVSLLHFLMVSALSGCWSLPSQMCYLFLFFFPTPDLHTTESPTSQFNLSLTQQFVSTSFPWFPSSSFTPHLFLTLVLIGFLFPSITLHHFFFWPLPLWQTPSADFWGLSWGL